MVVIGGPSSILGRLARASPARVFVVEGAAPPDDADFLVLSPEVEIVDSPRSATILLVVGELPVSLTAALEHVHDAMAGPRRSVVWRSASTDVQEPIVARARVIVGDARTAASTLARLQTELLSLDGSSEAPLLPDVEAAEWRGVGPFGQGGTGMTGGVPYGRPMAETAPDRDGLRLDQLSVRIGPFFPPFPSGLVIEMKLQGDVIQEAVVGPNPFSGVSPGADAFRRSLTTAVSVAELEMARSRSHLRAVARALRVHGLRALALRALRAADALVPGEHAPVRALQRLLERTRAFGAATHGVGVLSPDAVRGRGLGVVARASGVMEDARAEDDTYRRLGFEPLTQEHGDARARWRLRLAEVEQSVTLAARAGGAGAMVRSAVESPRGLLTLTGCSLDVLIALVPTLIAGCEWGDAVTSIVSLDIDLRAGVVSGAAAA